MAGVSEASETGVLAGMDSTNAEIVHVPINTVAIPQAISFLAVLFVVVTSFQY